MKILKSSLPGACAIAPSVITGEDRYQMIAIAAYYRAEHRGFGDGDPCTDWLEAEAEIDRLLGLAPSPGNQGKASEKQAYIIRLQCKLQEFDHSIENLTDKLRGSPRCTLDEYKAQVDYYREKRVAANQELQALRDCPDADWDGMISDAATLWQNLQRTIDNVAAFVALLCVNRKIGKGWMDSQAERRNLRRIAQYQA